VTDAPEAGFGGRVRSPSCLSGQDNYLSVGEAVELVAMVTETLPHAHAQVLGDLESLVMRRKKRSFLT